MGRRQDAGRERAMSAGILFCGPIPAPEAPAVGGYEACNRRTIAALRQAGALVHELHYPQPRGGKLAKLRGYGAGFLALRRQIAATPGAIFHLTGLYKHFALAEILLLRQARRHGLRTVYDIRAGAMHKHYARLGPLYRWLFRRLLRSADQVMVEGTDYEAFVQQVTGKPAFYLPNHINAAGIPPRAPEQPAVLRLIYVGRVNLEKGVETALQTAAALRSRGLACELAIAGPAEPALQQRLQADYGASGAQWLGALTAAQVLEQLGQSHIFLFATRHAGEGHSNALTEAMAMGCVPVATDNGFNRSVIGDTGRILPLSAPAADYADAIEALWRGGAWPALSAAAQARTKLLFSTEQAVARLQDRYQHLLKAPL
ncbi:MULTISPECIES: glycosyltransferase family 4 protein [unclassified Duganella]|uniref:glycosyltransferase family 4 protein n=1 Tax=unclassified Duganella TaxID=2636909 RepID=UPI001314C138|nr:MULTISPECIES: glycosyltransferase family 4 protein [unclassified Duganella]